ncbi:MAG: hypothetical protein WA517_15720, partial [Candidatus Acidiferrum sp.]
MSVAVLVGFSLSSALATPFALDADQTQSAAKLLARTMFNPEFRVKSFRGGEWFGNGNSYLA